MKTITTQKSRKPIVAVSLITIFIIAISLLALNLSPSIPLEVFNVDNAYRHMEELTKDDYKGRVAGSAENLELVNYLERQFREIGLKPAFDGSYLMSYRTITPQLLDQPYAKITTGSGNTIELIRGVNFKERIDDYSGNGQVKGEITYIKNFDELTNSDLENKILLIDYKNFPGNTPLKVDYYIHLRRAKAVIYLEDVLPEDNIRLGDKLNVMTERKIVKIGVTKPVYESILNSVQAGEKPMVDMGVFVAFKSNVELKNVVGIIPGEGIYKNEVIVLTANFDGLGTDYDGNIYSGAIENASGMATLLELARTMSENSTGPRKTIIIAALNGKEIGFTGSEFLTHKFLSSENFFPKYRVTSINIDSLGAKDSQLVVETLQSGGAKRKASGLLATKVGYYLDKSEIQTRIIPNSFIGEHVSFIFNGMPSVTIKGMGNNISRIDDRMDVIDKDTLGKSGRQILSLINHLAYDISILAHFIPPFVKTLPLILVSMLLWILKLYCMKKDELKNNPVIKYLINKPVIFASYCITMLFFIFSLHSYLSLQATSGIYLISDSSFSYNYIINFTMTNIFSIAFMVFGEFMILLIPILLCMTVFYLTPKEVPTKIILGTVVAIFGISQFIRTKTYFAPSTLTITPEILRFDYSNVIFPIIVTAISLLGFLIFYYENKKHSDRNKHIDRYGMVMVLATVSIVFVICMYGPYFLHPDAINARQFMK